MRHLTAFFIASLLACSGSNQAPAPTPTPVADSPLSKALDQHIAQFGKVRGESHRFSGHVFIVRGDDVLYDRGFGAADRKSGAPNTPDTSFRIGSVTKQFTATAIYLLEKQGKLKLSDSIRTHLADYPKPAGDQVTIQHLLTHTGGVPSYTADEAVMARRAEAMTTAQLLATFKDKPLEFAPGEEFAYSNSGYALLGAIIEKVTGKSYGEHMREAVFAPAGLDSTVVGDAPTAKDRALGYQVANGAVVDADPVDMSIPHAAGAIRSTSRDLATWHAVLAAGTLIDQETQARMQVGTEVSKTDAPHATRSYAAGWNIVLHKKLERRLVRHGGGIDGFGTAYVRVPADDLVVVVWTNKPIGNSGISEAALNAVYDKPIEPHVEKAVVALEPAAVARLVGVYALTEKSAADALAAGVPEENLESIRTIEVKSSGASIEVKPAGQPAIPFEAESETAFTFSPAAIRIEFELGSDGKAAAATAITLKQGPLTLRLERKE